MSQLPADVRAAVATLLQRTYAGFNDCHATEKLREVEGLMLSRSSVRRLRRTLGLPAKRQRWGRLRRCPAAQMVPSCSSTPAPSRGWKPASVMR